MSYILDALRKAERERSSGPNAPLQIVTHGGTPQIAVPRRPWWPWALAGVSGLIALAAIAALVMTRKPTPPAPPAVSVAPPGPAVVAPPDDELAELPADEVLDEEILDEGEAPIDESAAVGSLDDLARPRTPMPATPPRPLRPFDASRQAAAGPKPAPPPDEEYPEDQDSVVEFPPDEAGEPLVEPFDSGEFVDEPAPEEQPLEEVTASPPPAATSPTPTPAPTTTVETLKLDPAPSGQIKLLKEMDPAYRADFPQLKVEVHVHDDQREKRWVIISGKRYREGDSIAQGPRIVQIVRDGIVFEHRGRQVLYPR